jgi:hypothetical protein
MDIVRPQNIQRQAVPAKRKKPYMIWVKIAAGIVAVVVIVLAVLWSRGSFDAQQIDGSKYQAVYTLDGKMYFGKLQNSTGTYLVVKKPYTTQTTQTEDKTAEAQTTLVKVSGQVYGPEDSIALKSDQVVFWQNLRSDSKVSQAIQSKE